MSRSCAFGTVSVLNARTSDSAPQHFPARVIDELWRGALGVRVYEVWDCPRD